VKPAEYSESRIVTEDAPYHVEDLKGTHSDPGMLHLGRVVWGKKSPEGQSPEQRVSVYAEGVGLVSLESRFLRPPQFPLGAGRQRRTEERQLSHSPQSEGEHRIRASPRR